MVGTRQVEDLHSLACLLLWEERRKEQLLLNGRGNSQYFWTRASKDLAEGDRTTTGVCVVRPAGRAGPSVFAKGMRFYGVVQYNTRRARVVGNTVTPNVVASERNILHLHYLSESTKLRIDLIIVKGGYYPYRGHIYYLSTLQFPYNKKAHK